MATEDHPPGFHEEVAILDRRLTGVETRFEAFAHSTESKLDKLLDGQVTRREADEQKTEAIIQRAVSSMKDVFVERLTGVEKTVESLRPRVDEIQRVQLSSGKPNYVLIVSASSFLLALVIAVVGLGGYFTNSTLGNRILPVESDLHTIKQQINGFSHTDLDIIKRDIEFLRSRDGIVTSENATSHKDREDLNLKSAKLEQQAAEFRSDVRADISRLSAGLVEVETQFRSEDQIRNVQWADMRRTFALLWEKVFGTRYPSDVSFYPSIAQPSPGAGH